MYSSPMPIVIESDASTTEELLAQAKEEVDGFDQFFQEKLGNSRMTPSERAILMTYLHYATMDKHQGVEEGPEGPTP